jgi:hypothetical protein
VKRAAVFNCKHEGATRQYVSTFSSIARVVLCQPCIKAINDNLEDPRYVGETVSDAVRGRDEVKHASN